MNRKRKREDKFLCENASNSTLTTKKGARENPHKREVIARE